MFVHPASRMRGVRWRRSNPNRHLIMQSIQWITTSQTVYVPLRVTRALFSLVGASQAATVVMCSGVTNGAGSAIAMKMMNVTEGFPCVITLGAGGASNSGASGGTSTIVVNGVTMTFTGSPSNTPTNFDNVVGIYPYSLNPGGVFNQPGSNALCKIEWFY
jgi:hypothetical protein